MHIIIIMRICLWCTFTVKGNEKKSLDLHVQADQTPEEDVAQKTGGLYILLLYSWK